MIPVKQYRGNCKSLPRVWDFLSSHYSSFLLTHVVMNGTLCTYGSWDEVTVQCWQQTEAPRVQQVSSLWLQMLELASLGGTNSCQISAVGKERPLGWSLIARRLHDFKILSFSALWNKQVPKEKTSQCSWWELNLFCKPLWCWIGIGVSVHILHTRAGRRNKKELKWSGLTQKGACSQTVTEQWTQTWVGRNLVEEMNFLPSSTKMLTFCNSWPPT